MPIDHPAQLATGIVRLPTSQRSRRRMFRRLPFGAVPGMAPICCDNNDPAMVDCGFRQRLLRKVPESDPALLAEFAAFVKSYLAKNVRVARKLSFEDWLSSTSYTEARKCELRVEFLHLRGGRPTKRQASHIDTFVKTEDYPDFKWCRMINSRSDAFKVFSGPLFKAVEEVVYELPEFIKHYPVRERPALIRALRQAGVRYYMTDFKAFESHFVRAVMDICECALYRHCLSWCKDAEFLCQTLMGTNRMRTRSGVSAQVEARRMSGDMCTSLGNGFTNLMLAKFLAHRQGKELRGFVEGDDGLFATEASLTIEDYDHLGFTMSKLEEIPDPCEGSFCGMVFADSGQIIRDPIKFCQSFGWTSSFVSAGTAIMEQLLRAKALSCAYETPHCPIVGAMARAALHETRGVTPRFVQDGYHERPHDEHGVEDFSPSDDTRALFAKLYGITPELQIEIETRILAGNLDIVDLLGPATAPSRSYARCWLEVG